MPRYYLTSPTVDDVSPVSYDPGLNPLGVRAARLMGNNPRGRTVYKKTDNTYVTTDSPSSSLWEDATVASIRFPDGVIRKAIYQGGHRTEVTESEKTALEAAGYTVVTE